MILPFVSVALASQAFLSPITPIAYTSYYNDKPAYEYSSNVQAPSYNYQSYVRSGDVDQKFVKIATPVIAAAPAPVIAAAPTPVIAAKAVALAPAPVAFAQPAVLRAAAPAPFAFAQPAFFQAQPAPATFFKAQPTVVRVEQAPTFVKAAPVAATFVKAEPAPVYRTAYYTASAPAPAFYAAAAPQAFRYAYYQAEEKKPEAKFVAFAPSFAPTLRFAQPAAIVPTLKATPAQVFDTVQEVKVSNGVFATKTQYHTQNELGEATYGHSEPTQSHVAVQDAEGNKSGSFSYIAPNGRLLTTNYVADQDGYRVASNALPKDEQPAVLAN